MQNLYTKSEATNSVDHAFLKLSSLPDLELYFVISCMFSPVVFIKYLTRQH